MTKGTTTAIAVVAVVVLVGAGFVVYKATQSAAGGAGSSVGGGTYATGKPGPKPPLDRVIDIVDDSISIFNKGKEIYQEIKDWD
jgi:hypothetical protein